MRIHMHRAFVFIKTLPKDLNVGSLFREGNKVHRSMSLNKSNIMYDIVLSYITMYDTVLSYRYQNSQVDG